MTREVHFSTSTLLFIAGVIVILCAVPIGSWTQSISVSRERLCVTEGAVEEMPVGRLNVNVSKMRAYVNALTEQLVEAQFTYLGSTGNEARLGSGELRRQFGLKLRAQDACNLVYVMWRIDPESKLVVSIKSNPGQHTSRVWQPWIPKHQATPQHSSFKSASWRNTHAPRGNEGGLLAGIHGQFACLGR